MKQYIQNANALSQVCSNLTMYTKMKSHRAVYQFKELLRS